MGKEKRNGLAGEEFTAKGLEAGTMDGRLGVLVSEEPVLSV
jgi:hypothetical protein